MGFTPGGSPRVTIVLVTLGYHERMIACLERLAALDDRVEFGVVCVVNGADLSQSLRGHVPHGVVVVEYQANLGWVGGLHVARPSVVGEYMAWMQDDIVPEHGWLDATVAVLDADASVGIVGAVAIGADGQPKGPQAGFTPVGQAARDWRLSMVEGTDVPTSVTRCAWVSSGGAVTRVSVWDELGGVDVRMYPLGFVDFAYCAHARTHGWGVALEPGARIHHERHGSAPGPLADFVGDRNLRLIDALWTPALRPLGLADASPTEHECLPWQGGESDIAVQAALVEASRIVVPFSRAVGVAHQDRVDYLSGQYERAQLTVDRMLGSLSWRVTAPIRIAAGHVRRGVGAVKRGVARGRS